MTNTSENNTATDPDSESESTTSVSRRWVYTNDLLAGLLLGSLPILTALGSTQILALTSVPNSWRVAYLVVVESGHTEEFVIPVGTQRAS